MKYIDVTPTWEAILATLLMCYQRTPTWKAGQPL